MTDQLTADETDTIDDAPVTVDESAEPVERPGRFSRFSRRNRISKWDRPPDPHDWRFWVGNVGKVLIATGLLLFGFVAYQLWGTGIETARAQNKLENKFEAALIEAGIDPDSLVVADAVDDVSTGGPDASRNTDDVVNDPAVRGDDPDAPDLGTADISSGDRVEEGLPVIGDDDITMPVAVDLSEEAVALPPRPVVRGDALLRLDIPRIGRSDYVLPGVSLDNLKDGPGHYPDTPLPGQLGNASIAGHRTTYGAPFFDVDQLRAGDEMIVTYTNGDQYVYEVTFVEVVTAADYHVVTTTDPNIAEMTLTSCHPKYTARDRIVVHSVLDPARSSNVGVATFYELEPDPDEQPIPGDDPVIGGDEAVAEPEPELDANGIEVTGPDESIGLDPEIDAPEAADDDATAQPDTDRPAPSSDADVDDAPAAAADGAADRPDGDVTTATGDEPAPIDAFSQGWFDDRDAFPQIALWGLLLTIISLLAYQVSKKTRHDSIGFAVGIFPFLFALYFFFQNVNRLLPPGI